MRIAKNGLVWATIVLLPTYVGCLGTSTTVTYPTIPADDADSVSQLEGHGAKLTKDGNGNVVEVDFRGTSISDDALQGLTGLKVVRSLKLNDTEITDSGLATIGQVATLTNLDLRGCGVTDAGVQSIGGLSKLKALRFSGKTGKTDITDDSMATIGKLSELKVLAIDFLKFAGGSEGLAALDGLGLTEFYASNTLMNDEGLELIAERFPTLKKLRVSGCQVSSEGLKSIAKMTNLEEVDLSENTSILDDGLAHLASLKNLKKLNLWRVPITDDGVASLAGLTEMEWLNLDNVSYLSDDGLPHLKGMTKLKFLHLGSTAVSDEGMKHLTTLKALDDLKVTRTSVTEAGVNELKKTLTNTAIQLEYEGT